MNKQIFSLLGAIGASPYMIGAKRLNSQYAAVETLYGQGAYAACVAACGEVLEELLGGLYLGVMGETARLSVILSDIEFWRVIDDRQFCDTAGMLQYACCRLAEESGAEPEKAARLATTGLDDVIEHAARFLARSGAEKCVDPAVLKREDMRERVRVMTEGLRAKLDAAGCSGGFSMQPPFMNAFLLDFPERENAAWTRFLAGRLQRAGLLTTARVGVLDAERVVDERVGLTNEFIRRAAAGANGGALLIEHFEEFDMPCLGGNLLDRALKTTLTAAEKYRGSLCIVVAGRGESVERAFRRAEAAEEAFPLFLALREK